MLYSLQAKLKTKRGYSDRPRADQGYTGIDPLWTIRGYFIGLSIDYAPPYITILCSDSTVSRWLVKLVQEELDSGRYPGWCMTRLPYVSVIAYGSPSGSIDNTGDEGSAGTGQEPKRKSEADAEEEGNLERVQVEVDAKYAVPTMINELLSWGQHQHRCGIRLQITRGSNIITRGTIGGLIQVGGKPYGLTVAHSFPLTFNEARLQDPGDDQISDIINAWRQSTSFDMEFDLALIEMPGLQDQTPSFELWDDVNLVRTVSGIFRPVSIAWDQPRALEQVALATPRSRFCLRGAFIGSQVLMPMPNSTALCIPWVLRMERPWLIQPGDSGSWAFNSNTGELLGILIAGCPELLEAYILPAHQAFDNIQKRLGDRVTLPNCQPLQKENWDGLAHVVNSYEKISSKIQPSSATEAIKVIEAIEAIETIEAVENEFARWTSGCATVLEATDSSETSSMSFQLRVTRASWEDPSPQQCIDVVNEIISNKTDSAEKQILYPFWRYLMLGQEELLANTEDWARKDVIANEYKLMTRLPGSKYSRWRVPWDRRTLTSAIETMESDIQENLRLIKDKCGWFSLPETMQIGLLDHSDAILTAVRIFNHSKDLVLVVMPPPTVGPTTATFHSDGLTIKGSSLRYPFKLGIKTTGAAEAMKEELITKLELDATDFDYVRKLPLRPKWSTLYLKEHRRRVEFVVYEGVLKFDKELPATEFAEGWVTMHEPLVNSLLLAMATPFYWLTWMEETDC
ncbi:uncharacterized protein FOBCDRAFT_324649 [Fusarium oxysporum Fo47]|uniref:uncharacterized protein n=1 Tax=Fusarium oxysporum Fo47 TaxID=660027 RepID=UPI0028698C69|nr:uncharacterized protein FOBCDRAFT_324649 [Fusarium oxysporum Fo47]QKD62387.2 hypothetical protein FOBCDRAFT_324649 [Fusarium oxysporum Fo47]